MYFRYILPLSRSVLVSVLPFALLGIGLTRRTQSPLISRAFCVIDWWGMGWVMVG